MSKPLQIREVPDPVLATLRERAKQEHTSMSAYVLNILMQHVQTKTMAEILSGPRRIKGPRLSNEEILEYIHEGRR